MVTLFLVLAIAALVALAFSVGVIVGRRARRPGDPPSMPDASGEVASLRFDPIAPLAPSVSALPDCPPEWRAEMSAIGQRLAANDVRAVVFVHGTFAGDDPIAVGRLLKRVCGDDVERAVRGFVKARIDRWLGDGANWSPEYVRLFEAAIGGGIPCVRFVWSSENHHLARAVAAVRLARYLASAVSRDRGRVLVIGHSHAGQVLALLTRLLEPDASTRAVVDAVAAAGEPVDDLDGVVARLRGLAIDVATLGAPIRYAWAPARNVRALHVVHRRSVVRRVPSLAALFRGHDHDAIHWLGGSGSDIPPLSRSERKVNAALDAALDPGASPRALVASLRAPRPAVDFGHTIHVDYGEELHASDRGARSLFGHAAYTRAPAMLFTSRVVADHFYPVAPEDARLRSPQRSA